MANTYFMHRIKRTNGTYDKGIEIKATLDDALQSFHAYLGAYAYGHDANTDYVECQITSTLGEIDNAHKERWYIPEQPEPEE